MLGHLAFGVICGLTAALHGASADFSGLAMFLAYSLGGSGAVLVSLTLGAAPQGLPS